MQKTRKAFTLVELLIAMLIMAASWYIAMTYSSNGQTAQREARKLQAILESNFAKAERQHKNIRLLFYKDNFKKISVHWIDDDVSEDITLTEGCECRCNKSLYNDSTNSEIAGTTRRVHVVYTFDEQSFSPTCLIGVAGAADDDYSYFTLSLEGHLSVLSPTPTTDNWGWGKKWKGTNF